MGASVKSAHQETGRRRRGRRNAPMSEINVTPFVDVMLVLLIIFMVAAPLLQVGVPIELPQSKGQQLAAKKTPLILSVKPDGSVFIDDAQVPLGELGTKLKAMTKENLDEQVFVRGDKGVNYGAILKVMGEINGSGFHKISLVGQGEDGG
jgi:biopolymer transport protein TolR